MITETKSNIQRHLVPERPGNRILGFAKGTQVESGIHITQQTKDTEPDVWGRVPRALRDAIDGGSVTLFIDTVGNTALQGVYKIPAVPSTSSEVIDITPSLPTVSLMQTTEAAAD